MQFKMFPRNLYYTCIKEKLIFPILFQKFLLIPTCNYAQCPLHSVKLRSVSATIKI